MATIYEDVETLKQQMTVVQNDLATLSGNIPDVNDLLLNDVVNVTEENLNTLIGEIIVGYGDNCVNKPDGATNGYFINIPHTIAQYVN